MIGPSWMIGPCFGDRRSVHHFESEGHLFHALGSQAKTVQRDVVGEFLSDHILCREGKVILGEWRGRVMG